MLGSDIIAKTLKKVGVKRVFLYPGGTVAPLLDSLLKEEIDYICTKNEQGAGYAAIGAAKVSGEPQVVIVTSGPGSTNVLTPIADAFFDSVPILLFTGQVAINDINTAHIVRQKGFQEIDSVNIYSTVTKKAHVLSKDDDISRLVFDSFNLTKSGRPGPVLIDLPMDTQRTEIEETYTDFNFLVEGTISSVDQPEIDIGSISQDILNSKRPLILAGNGIHISKTENNLLEFVEKTSIPVVHSLPGLGAIPSNHELSFSFIGHTGEYFANLSLYHCDLLLVLGARLDIRQTGSEIADFNKTKKIIRIDIDKTELDNSRIKSDTCLNIDLKEFFCSFMNHHKSNLFSRRNEWINRIKKWKSEYHSPQFFKDLKLSSYDIIKSVDNFTKDKKVTVSTGVGGHQQMAARYFSFSYPDRRWLTSAGHGTMGFDVPSIIGAIIEERRDFGIVFVGDGSFLMNIQELATIKELNLPIKIFVLNNSRLGVVSQFQLAVWGNDPSTGNKKNPSFSKIGKAFGLNGYDITDKTTINLVLEDVFNDPSPAIVDCHIDYSEDTLPMLMGGQKLNEMHPFIKRD